MLLKKKFESLFNNIVSITTDFFANYEGLYSTQVAFYFIISSVPLIMLLLSLLKYIYPINLRSIIDIINATIPATFSYYVIRVIRELYTQSSIPMISITAITSLWAASKSTYALSMGLKTIYKTLPSKISAKRTVFNRIVSLFDTLLLIAILIFSAVSLVFDKLISNIIQMITPAQLSFILDIVQINYLYSIVVITIAFTFMYKFFSRTSIPLFRHLPGAFIASVAWASFSYLYSLYFNNFSSFSVTYGALAAVVFLMLWLKTCMMILLYGAQINMFLYEKKGDK